MSGINYHTRGRGRPRKSEEDKGPIKPTKEQQKKREKVFRYNSKKSGDLSCPIDIMEGTSLITQGEADAIRTYKRLWATAYGQPSRYSGNVWLAMIQGFGIQNSYEEDVDRKKLAISRYHEVDGVLRSYGKEAWLSVRTICEGKTPMHLAGAIEQRSEVSRLLRQIESLDKILENIKESNKKNKNTKALASPNSIIMQKRRCLKAIENLSHIDYYQTGKVEHNFYIWAREQFKLSLKGLMREFKIEE
jgi:hypothetical protein